MEIIKETARKIRSLKIQGATNIALSSLAALREDFEENRYQDVEMLEEKIRELKKSRPTEPLLFNILKFLLEETKRAESLNNFEKIVDLAEEKILKAQKRTGENGARMIKDGMRVFTHCHSATVVEILKRAKRKGKRLEVFLTETRPLYQGRITAKELIKAGIETTMIVDAAAPYIISKEDKIPINLVLLGCDAIFPKKGVFNKIGSYGIALASFEAKVPVFVAGLLLKTSLKTLLIERRKTKEVWEGKLRSLKILNLAFDFVPQRFIKGIISEFGVVGLDEVLKVVSQNYPFIL